MGSDLHMNPPPPPPVWEQVKALQERYKDATLTINRQRAQIEGLEQKLESNDRLVAKLLRELEERDA